uniref:Uncharacterized protein n=1 Tax=Arundo donax TaxID=35708 RepID=A0A0A9C8S4_ARUDO
MSMPKLQHTFELIVDIINDRLLTILQEIQSTFCSCFHRFFSRFNRLTTNAFRSHSTRS